MIQSPAKEERKKKAAKVSLTRGPMVRSGLTQLMVFLNGLILTVTAFVVLSVFIDQMRSEDMRSMATQVNNGVQAGIVRLSDTLDAAGRAVELFSGPGAPADGLSPSDFRKFVPNHALFDRIVLFRKTDGAWSSQMLYHSETSGGPLLPDSSALDSIDPAIPFFIRMDAGAAMLSADNSGAGVEVRPMMIFHPVVFDGGVRFVVVGSVSLGRGLDMGPILGNESIQKLIIRDGETGARLLQLDRRIAGQDREQPFFSAKTSTDQWRTVSGTVSFDVFMEAQENLRMVFISRVPLLLLLFGLSITMIGTLYVRNSYRQSMRLSVMNNTLAAKNLELKNKVDESSRLYEAMQRSEREYRGVIDSVTDIIFECDGVGNIMFVNATWEKVTGFDIPHSLGRDLFEMLHPADQEQQRQAFAHMVRDRGAAYRSITRLQTSDGKFRAVDLAFSMVRSDNMRNARVVGTITDVEERRRAEKALAEAEKKYRTIVENAAGGIYQVNTAGRILSANPALARILGFNTPRDVMEGVPDMGKIYTDPRDRLRYEHELETFGFIRNHEVTITRRDGQVIWISENARAVKDDDGRLLFFEGSVEDVTQRKLSEQALKEAKMQSDLANRAKSEFLANMSHELRTPLNAIIGFSEIIRNEAMGPVGTKAYTDYAGDINDSGKKLLSVINDILDISRIEAGERMLNETLFNLHGTAASCVSLLSSKAEAGRVTVINNLHTDMPKVIGEELAFKQILTNLLSNAIKFTPPQGRVSIECEYAGNGHDMRLSISDTGIGMDEREIEKALSPFGQVESAFSRSNSGTGLGLTLVDSLVKMHEGRFELLSRKGVGTTATIVIPAHRVAQVAPPRADADNITVFPRSLHGDQ